MCGYCEERLTFESIDLNLGVLGDFELNINISKSGYFETVLKECGKENLLEHDIAIKYCPYCGERLGRNENY